MDLYRAAKKEEYLKKLKQKYCWDNKNNLMHALKQMPVLYKYTQNFCNWLHEQHIEYNSKSVTLFDIMMECAYADYTMCALYWYDRYTNEIVKCSANKKNESEKRRKKGISPMRFYDWLFYDGFHKDLKSSVDAAQRVNELFTDQDGKFTFSELEKEFFRVAVMFRSYFVKIGSNYMLYPGFILALIPKHPLFAYAVQRRWNLFGMCIEEASYIPDIDDLLSCIHEEDEVQLSKDWWTFTKTNIDEKCPKSPRLTEILCRTFSSVSDYYDYSNKSSNSETSLLSILSLLDEPILKVPYCCTQRVFLQMFCMRVGELWKNQHKITQYNEADYYFGLITLTWVLDCSMEKDKKKMIQLFSSHRCESIDKEYGLWARDTLAGQPESFAFLQNLMDWFFSKEILDIAFKALYENAFFSLLEQKEDSKSIKKTKEEIQCRPDGPHDLGIYTSEGDNDDEATDDSEEELWERIDLFDIEVENFYCANALKREKTPFDIEKIFWEKINYISQKRDFIEIKRNLTTALKPYLCTRISRAEKKKQA